MRNSRSFFNFALVSCIAVVIFLATGCKGRTMENMEPSGDTIEVVINQDTTTNTINTNL